MQDFEVKTKTFDTPILLMVFNRPDTTQEVFVRIRDIKPARLFISADGPRASHPDDIEKCKEVREIVSQVDWPCEVKTLFQEKNLGCQIAPSSAITWFFEHVEKGIILEDDCIPDPTFFPFCAELLNLYEHDERVMQISANFYGGNKKMTTSYYFSNIPRLWGWATWRRAWKLYDIEMKFWPEAKKRKLLRKALPNLAVYEYWEYLWDSYYNGSRDSWDRPWAFACMYHNGLSINSTINLISNIGFGVDATHTKTNESKFANESITPMSFPLNHPLHIKIDTEMDAFSYQYYFNINKGLKERIFGPIRRTFPSLYNNLKRIIRNQPSNK